MSCAATALAIAAAPSGVPASTWIVTNGLSVEAVVRMPLVARSFGGRIQAQLLDHGLEQRSSGRERRVRRRQAVRHVDGVDVRAAALEKLAHEQSALALVHLGDRQADGIAAGDAEHRGHDERARKRAQDVAEAGACPSGVALDSCGPGQLLAREVLLGAETPLRLLTTSAGSAASSGGVGRDFPLPALPGALMALAAVFGRSLPGVGVQRRVEVVRARCRSPRSTASRAHTTSCFVRALRRSGAGIGNASLTSITRRKCSASVARFADVWPPWKR